VLPTASFPHSRKDKGITDNEKLAAAGADPAGRKELAALCGCDVEIILELCNRADLACITKVWLFMDSRLVGYFAQIRLLSKPEGRRITYCC